MVNTTLCSQAISQFRKTMESCYCVQSHVKFKSSLPLNILSRNPTKLGHVTYIFDNLVTYNPYTLLVKKCWTICKLVMKCRSRDAFIDGTIIWKKKKHDIHIHIDIPIQ